MSKISLTDLVNLQNETTAVNAINNNNQTLETAFDNTLSRDGTAPNTMGASLDMNNNQILNLPAPSTVNSPARLVDVVTNPTIVLPSTGTSGHVVPFLDGVNTWSGAQTFSAGVTANLSTSTNLPITTGVSGLGANVATFLATPSSANLASAMTDETGSGANVFATSPTLVTPILGTPTSGTLTNATGLPVATGISGLGTGVATFLATPTSANFAAAITNETGTGLVVLNSTPSLTTPVITNPNIIGTATNDSAAAGSVGEYISSTIATGSSVSLVSSTPANITSISLTAGDWTVWGTVAYTTTGTTSITLLAGSVSLTTATLAAPSASGGNQAVWSTAANVTGSLLDPSATMNITPTRISIASTTTVFLVSQQVFTASTLKGWGFIAARRIR